MVDVVAPQSSGSKSNHFFMNVVPEPALLPLTSLMKQEESADRHTNTLTNSTGNRDTHV